MPIANIYISILILSILEIVWIGLTLKHIIIAAIKNAYALIVILSISFNAFLLNIGSIAYVIADIIPAKIPIIFKPCISIFPPVTAKNAPITQNINDSIFILLIFSLYTILEKIATNTGDT